MSDAFINIRGNASDDTFVSAASDALGQDLPTEPNTTSRGDHCVFWLGPDEWMVMSAVENRAEILEKLESALASTHSAVNDLSGGNVTYSLSGADVLDVLAQGCTLDFALMKVGDCAQTGLGKAGVLISREGDSEFKVIVRRSFADYLGKWLEHAGRAREIVFQ